MSVEGWIASVTGVVIAVGTAILVFYTPFGPSVRRSSVAAIAVVRAWLRPLANGLSSRLHSRWAWGVAAMLIVLSVWSLALPSLFPMVGASSLWTWRRGLPQQ
jgi:hypothetical protein